MKVIVKKWGNSAALRIPASMMKSVNIDLDETVEMRTEDGRIVIEPVARKGYDLDMLLSGITAKNCHAETDFGAPVGKEIW